MKLSTLLLATIIAMPITYTTAQTTDEALDDIGILNKKTKELLTVRCHERADSECKSVNFFVSNDNEELGDVKLNKHPVSMDDFRKTKVNHKRPLWTEYKASAGVIKAGTIPLQVAGGVYSDFGFQEAVVPAVFMFGAGIPVFVAPGIIAGAASVSVYVAGAVTFVAESLYSAVRLPIIALTDPKVKVNKALVKLKNGESSTLNDKAFNRLTEFLTGLGNKKLKTRVTNQGPDEMYFDLPTHPKMHLPIALKNERDGSGACRLLGYDYAVEGSLLLSKDDQKSVILNDAGEALKVSDAKSVESVICKKDPMVTQPVCVINSVKVGHDYDLYLYVVDGSRIQMTVGSTERGDQKGMLALLKSTIDRGLCNNGAIPAKCSIIQSEWRSSWRHINTNIGKQSFQAGNLDKKIADKIMNLQIETGGCY